MPPLQPTTARRDLITEKMYAQLIGGIVTFSFLIEVWYGNFAYETLWARRKIEEGVDSRGSARWVQPAEDLPKST